MKKTILIWIGVLIFSLSLASCINKKLPDRKITAKESLDSYFLQRNQTLTIEYDWTGLSSLVAEGKNAIDDASSKKEVDALLKNTIKEIDALLLSDVLENQVKEDYLQQYGANLEASRCYGVYGNAVVLFIPGEDLWIKTVEISGLEFYYTSEWMILVWKNGVFYDLENETVIFENEILTRDNIEKIHSLHENWDME